MKQNVLLLFASIFLSIFSTDFCNSFVWAQTTAGAATQEEVYVKANLVSDTKSISPDSSFKLTVNFDLVPGWHIYYKKSGEAGLPTKIEWKLPPGFTASDLIWEKPNEFNDGGIKTFGYTNKTSISAVIKSPAKLETDKSLQFGANVKWLSCKDICVPGGTQLSITLPVGNSPASASVSTPATAPAENGQSHLFEYLFYAFIGGFILNFMPCVLPVISIKILSFVEQANEDRRQIFLLGSAFCAGIISSFLLLAGIVIALQQAGNKIGWGFQFQYPVFLLFMSCILLLFALSLFGIFYVQLGSSGELGKLAHKEGLSGAFFKGVLATVVSTPCTAPYVGSALGFAFAQSPAIIISIFLSIALGMAFPYFLLTANPSWMRFLPKPGIWMEKFKQAMGFLLIATIVWFLYVIGNQLGINAVIAALSFLSALAFAVWTYNNFTSLDSSQIRKISVGAISLLIIAAAYQFFLAPNPDLISTKAPSAKPMESQTNSSSSLINWQPFSQARLDKAIADKQIVFLDFTADWCLTCKVNEQTVLNTKAVADKISALNVLTLRADWTRQDPQISQMLSQFGRSGVPLYVIYPAGKTDGPIVLPELITQSIVLEKLDQAASAK